MNTHWGADTKGGISWRFHPAHPKCSLPRLPNNRLVLVIVPREPYTSCSREILLTEGRAGLCKELGTEEKL